MISSTVWGPSVGRDGGKNFEIGSLVTVTQSSLIVVSSSLVTVNWRVRSICVVVVGGLKIGLTEVAPFTNTLVDLLNSNNILVQNQEAMYWYGL